MITGELERHIEGRLLMYYVNMVRIIDPANVFPIMHFEQEGFRKYNGMTFWIEAKDTIFGVRSTANGRRTVILGICPYVIVREGTRQDLVTRILGWLAEQ